MFDEEDVFAASTAIIVILSAVTVAFLAKKRRHRFWIRPSLLVRRRILPHRFYEKPHTWRCRFIIVSIQIWSRVQEFFSNVSSTFEQLLSMIAPKITKMDTNMKESIPVHDRLGVTLKFLASSDSCRKYVQNTSRQHTTSLWDHMSHDFFFWSGPTFGGSRSWSHNLKCRTTHVAPIVHTSTTTTCFMLHNHVVPSRTTKFLSVWTHLYGGMMDFCIHSVISQKVMHLSKIL